MKKPTQPIRRAAKRKREGPARERLSVETETSGRQIANILERVSDGFAAFDEQMNYTYVNARGGELLGRSPADLIGKNYWKLSHK